MKPVNIFICCFFCLLAISAFAQTKSKSKTDSKPKTEAKSDTLVSLEEYTGTYAISGTTDFNSVIVTLENGKLMGRADVQPTANEMKATTTLDKFTIASSEAAAEVTFIRNDQKKVKGLKVYYNGVEVTGEKAN
jgi:hypothetical protein